MSRCSDLPLSEGKLRNLNMTRMRKNVLEAQGNNLRETVPREGAIGRIAARDTLGTAPKQKDFSS